VVDVNFPHNLINLFFNFVVALLQFLVHSLISLALGWQVCVLFNNIVNVGHCHILKKVRNLNWLDETTVVRVHETKHTLCKDFDLFWICTLLKNFKLMLDL
jgi:hypothetical protein